MKNAKLFLIFIVLVTFSCTKEEVNKVVFTDTLETEFPEELIPYHWQKIADPDSIGSGSYRKYIYDDLVVSAKRILYADDWGEPIVKPDIVKARDRFTGEILWTFDGYVDALHPGQRASIKSYTAYEHYYVISVRNAFYCIDVRNGSLIWSDLPFSHLSILAFPHSYEENAYFTFINQADDSSGIIKLNMITGVFEIVFTAYKDDEGYIPDISSVLETKNDLGETMLIFTDRRYNDDINEHYMSIYAYNIDQGKEVWKNERFEVSFGAISSKIYISGKKVFTGQRQINAFDLDTGERLWYSGDVFFQQIDGFFWDDGLLYGHSDDGFVYCLNEGGTVQWKVDINEGSFADCMPFGDHIIVTCRHSYFLRKASGIIEAKLEVHNREIYGAGSFLWTNPAISDDGEYIYHFDGYFDIAYKNPLMQ